MTDLPLNSPLTDAGPCMDGRCPLTSFCGSKQLACSAFHSFATLPRGRFHAWKKKPLMPDSLYFRQVYTAKPEKKIVEDPSKLTATCAECGGRFEPRSKRSKYCGKTCYQRMRVRKKTTPRSRQDL